MLQSDLHCSDCGVRYSTKVSNHLKTVDVFKQWKRNTLGLQRSLGVLENDADGEAGGSESEGDVIDVFGESKAGRAAAHTVDKKGAMAADEENDASSTDMSSDDSDSSSDSDSDEGKKGDSTSVTKEESEKDEAKEEEAVKGHGEEGEKKGVGKNDEEGEGKVEQKEAETTVEDDKDT